MIMVGIMFLFIIYFTVWVVKRAETNTPRFPVPSLGSDMKFTVGDKI